LTVPLPDSSELRPNEFRRHLQSQLHSQVAET
jgi:hypothetical protein